MAGLPVESQEVPIEPEGDGISEELCDEDRDVLIPGSPEVRFLEKIKLNITKDMDGNESTGNHDKLNPMDITAIQRPDRYDHQMAKISVWFDKFKDLLASRSGNWRKPLHLSENLGKVTIKSQDGFTESLDVATHKNHQKTIDQHNQRLQSYLRTYRDVTELMRARDSQELRSQYWSPHRPERLKPPRAMKTIKSRDLDEDLTDATHYRAEDSECKMDDEMMSLIWLNISATEHVKDVRELLTQENLEDINHSFHEALLDEIDARKVDEDTTNLLGTLRRVT